MQQTRPAALSPSGTKDPDEAPARGGLGHVMNIQSAFMLRSLTVIYVWKEGWPPPTSALNHISVSVWVSDIQNAQMRPLRDTLYTLLNH